MQNSHHGTEQVLRQCADMSGHHVPMFAVADGPPGVAGQHLSLQERTSEGVHAPGLERTAMISRLQVTVAAPYGGRYICAHESEHAKSFRIVTISRLQVTAVAACAESRKVFMCQ